VIAQLVGGTWIKSPPGNGILLPDPKDWGVGSSVGGSEHARGRSGWRRWKGVHRETFQRGLHLIGRDVIEGPCW